MCLLSRCYPILRHCLSARICSRPTPPRVDFRSSFLHAPCPITRTSLLWLLHGDILDLSYFFGFMPPSCLCHESSKILIIWFDMFVIWLPPWYFIYISFLETSMTCTYLYFLQLIFWRICPTFEPMLGLGNCASATMVYIPDKCLISKLLILHVFLTTRKGKIEKDI